MNGTPELFAWWNAIFSLPLMIATLYLLVTTFLGLGHGGGHDLSADHDVDVDHDVDLGHDVDVDHDVDLDHGLDVEHDVDVDHDVDIDHDADVGHDIHVGHGHAFDVGLHHGVDHDVHHGAEAQHGPGHDGDSDERRGAADSRGGVPELLLLLGAGKAPLSLVLQILMITWGVYGLVLNDLLGRAIVSPMLFIGPSMLISGVGSVATTRLSANVVGRIMPKEETAALSRRDLIGLQARAIFSVDTDSGAAHLTDRFGNLHQVAVRTEAGELPRGAEVVLVDYVPEHDYYMVAPLPDDLGEEPVATRLAEAADADVADDVKRTSSA